MAVPFKRDELELAQKSFREWDVSFSALHVLRSTKGAFTNVDYGQFSNIVTADAKNLNGLAHFCLEFCNLPLGLFSQPLQQIPLQDNFCRED